MASLGFISAEFSGGTFAEVLDKMVAAGAEAVQLDLASATPQAFPADLSSRESDDIRAALSCRRLTLAGVNGTYNMIHPDLVQREAGARNLERVISMAHALGAPLVSLCTGSRNTESMWANHPGNNDVSAWRDLLAGIERAAAVAEPLGIVLGIEPEINNTVNSLEKARRLLDEVGSPAVKIIMDGANIFQAGELPRMRQVLDRAFDLLGPDIALAHAKDLDHDGDAGHLPAGRGLMDYPYYLQCLADSGYDGAVILHSLTEEEAADRLRFVARSGPPGYFGASANPAAPAY